MLERSMGGGMWMMNGAHMVDCLLWFVGSPAVAVKAMVTNKIIGQNADDSILAFIEFANGTCATLAHTGTKKPEPPPAEQWLTTEVIGTEGSVKAISYEGQAWLNRDGTYERVTLASDAEREEKVVRFLNEESGSPIDTPLPQSAIEQTGGIWAEVSAFVVAINGGQAPPVSNSHALDVMRIILAVEESSRNGREILL